MVLLDLQPSLGPITGGTLVTINAEKTITPLGIKNSACKFGDTVFAPVNLTASGFVCAAPMQMRAQPLLVGVALNKHDFVSRSNVEYLFYEQPIVSTVNPTGGLIHGDTPISITGGVFKVDPNMINVRTRVHVHIKHAL